MVVTKRDFDVAELFLKAVAGLITSPNLSLEKFTKGKRSRVIENFGDLRKDLAEIMRRTILGMAKEDIKELIEKELYTDKTCATLEALFSAITKTEEVEGDQEGGEKTRDERNCLIGIVFEVLIAEFFAKEKEEEGKVKVSGELSCCYTWFILQFTAEKEILNLRDSFFQKIKEYLKNFEDFWKSRGDIGETTEENVKAFVTKCNIWIKHLQQLTTSARDVKRVWNRKGTRGKSHQHYFGEVTSLHFKYKVLLEAKEEANLHKLIQQDEGERCLFEDECIVVLQKLYDIFDRHTLKVDEDLSPDTGVEETREKKEKREMEKKNDIKDDYISAGFTLNELSELIKWSDERCSARVKIWIRRCLEMNEQPELQNYTWSEAKEAITALAIKKFKDASGFECSVEMIEKTIDRYKREVFDFKELAKAYRALTDIYEYQVDFNAKLKGETAERKKEMENARRNIMGPIYYNITFHNTSTTTHLRFLEGKSFIYRADAFTKPVEMWNMLEQWFPHAKIEKEKIKDDKKEFSDGHKMVVECFLVGHHDSPYNPSLVETLIYSRLRRCSPTQKSSMIARFHLLNFSTMPSKTLLTCSTTRQRLRRLRTRRTQLHPPSPTTGSTRPSSACQAC